MNSLSRRDWLKTVGAAVVGAPLLEAAEQDLRAKARQNLKLTVFSGVYAQLPLAEAARRIRADGFSGVILEYGFADGRIDPSAPDWAVVDRITGALRGRGLEIAGLYGYYNVVDPDPARRQRGQARMEWLITNWKRLGSPLIATETGTFNRQSEWVEAPENATEQGYLECRAALQRLVQAAAKTGATICLEPYWRNVIDSAQRAERLFKEVNSPALKLVMDPCNYFRKEDLPNMRTMLADIFRRVGRQTVLAHAKDVKAAAEGTDLPAAGEGVLDYPLYLRLLAELNRPLHLAIEHLTLEDVPRARDFVRGQIDRL
jgi:sugar phosphate isomerase/epimerase